MYTIANKHNKKTRKLPSSSRNKHKSKSKNKRKHKYTIGKTRKHTKSHNSLYSGGVLSDFPQSQTPKEETPFTFDDFKAKVTELTAKLNTNYTPQTLFSDLTVAAISITSEEDRRKAMDIVQSMNIFYSNNFPTNNRLMTFLKKFPNVTFTLLDNEKTFKQNLSKLGLDQNSTQAVADALKSQALQRTVKTTITSSDAIPSDEKILLIHATSTPNTTTTTTTTPTTTTTTTPKKVSTQQKDNLDNFVEMTELS